MNAKKRIKKETISRKRERNRERDRGIDRERASERERERNIESCKMISRIIVHINYMKYLSRVCDKSK